MIELVVQDSITFVSWINFYISVSQNITFLCIPWWKFSFVCIWLLLITFGTCTSLSATRWRHIQQKRDLLNPFLLYHLYPQRLLVILAIVLHSVACYVENYSSTDISSLGNFIIINSSEPGLFYVSMIYSALNLLSWKPMTSHSDKQQNFKLSDKSKICGNS